MRYRMTLIKDLHRLRKDYRIKPTIKVDAERDYYLFCIFPTVMMQPWIYRQPGDMVVDVTFLNMHILIGEWEYTKEEGGNCD